MINPADVVFVIFCALLVWLMTAGLALFYSGLSRYHHFINTLMMVLLPLGFGSVIWYLFGYSFAFDGNGLFIGGTQYFAFNHVSLLTSSRNLTIPDAVFAVFQGMFPLITLGIIAGSVIDRINFKAFSLFTIFWFCIVYLPLAHMTWGGGLIQQLGALDFAGGDVVHISSGVTALILALIIGPRQNIQPVKVTHAPALVTGGALLWLGWFGFNAGSALAINQTAIQALINTIIAGSLGFTLWQVLDYWHTKTVSLSGCFTGALTGLVLITPGAGFIDTQATFLTILVGTPCLYYLIAACKKHFGYDDALDAFGVHGIGGIIGGLATGLFANQHLSGIAGALQGNWSLLLHQLGGSGLTIIWAGLGTYSLIKLIAHWMPLTITDLTITRDQVEHGEDSFSQY